MSYKIMQMLFHLKTKESQACQHIRMLILNNVKNGAQKHRRHLINQIASEIICLGRKKQHLKFFAVWGENIYQ